MAFTPSENPITNPTRESYTELRPFRFWCQKVLPLVYDDSLSYYELLCKVVDYLNKTMEDVDHMNTDMDTLYSSFQEFQEGTIQIYNELVAYVNAYFDNLDVQDEIDNKLDAMAADGSLVTILEPTIASQISEWLEEHITPTTPSIDSSLTVPGAGADAKVTGDKIRDIENTNDFIFKNISQKKQKSLSEYTSPIVSGLLYQEVPYEKGIIDTITVRKNNDQSTNIIVAFIDIITLKIKKIFYFANQTGTYINLVINAVMDESFYIGVACTGMGYLGGTTPCYRDTSTQFFVGKTVSETLLGNYDLGFDVKYKYLGNTVLENVSTDNTYDYIIGSLNLDIFQSQLSSGWWFTDNLYPGGFVRSVTLKTPSGENQNAGLLLIDSVTNKVLFLKYDVPTAQNAELTIETNVFSENPFYVGMFCLHGGYTAIGDTNNYKRIAGGIYVCGEPLDLAPWDGNSVIKLGIKVSYENITKIDAGYNKTRRNMFICGDSITAGYPYNTGDNANLDIRYGEAIRRILGFNVFYGAESGNGWLYSTGSANAYSITNSTNFRYYDAALYAWGTNDYYHDMPMGDITDNYASQTICGTMNYCIDKVYRDNPYITMIISTPLNRRYNNGFGFDTANNAGYTLKQLCDKMVELCESRGVPYITHFVSPLNKNNYTYALADGLHPSKIGYEMLGQSMSAKVGSILVPYKTSCKGL